jgi:dihydroorotate dehydrogenase electron transfer subunit
VNCGNITQVDPNPLHAKFYADHAHQLQVGVIENVQVARDTYRIRLEAPQTARQIVPGQFIMVRLPAGDDPLLARPLALYDTVIDKGGDLVGLDVVYLVVGKMTRCLAACEAGDQLEIWGPLGNGFVLPAAKHLVMVAGGIGQTPFLALGREQLQKRNYGLPPRKISPSQKVTLCYGARSADLLAGIDDFRAAGIDVRVATDDGTAGHHGLVTDLLGRCLAEAETTTCRVVCCGPEAMMEAVARVSASANVPCQVSLETPMACGIGICFSCVTKVTQPDGTWDYKRTCVDGPVFDAETIVW